jgi:hypothetical protein
LLDREQKESILARFDLGLCEVWSPSEAEDREDAAYAH